MNVNFDALGEGRLQYPHEKRAFLEDVEKLPTRYQLRTLADQLAALSEEIAQMGNDTYAMTHVMRVWSYEKLRQMQEAVYDARNATRREVEPSKIIEQRGHIVRVIDCF